MRAALGDKWLVLAVLLIPSLGPAIVKPCVAGTTARASSENVRSLGYSIYYTLVNIGGAVGPVMAWLVRKTRAGNRGRFSHGRLLRVSDVLGDAAVLSGARRRGDQKVENIAGAFKNMFIVLGNFRFVTFLLIVSGFYIVFFQMFVSVPLFIRDYVNRTADVDLMLSIDGITVICLQILATYLTRKMRPIHAIALGFLITGLAWAPLAVHPSVPVLAATLVIVALGEIAQASRYYEYCSRLAPAGQQGLYMGYAFLPIAIGYFVAGALGGHLVHEFGDVLHRPAQMWWLIVAIGVATSGLMWLYGKIVKPLSADASAS